MDRRKRTARTVALMSLFSMTDTKENVPVASFVGDGSDLFSLIVGIDPVQDLNGYDNPWPPGGGKNKLPNVATSGASNGITRTFNDDGSITLDGTASATFNINIASVATNNWFDNMPDGEYILTGCPVGGSASKYRIVVNINSGARYAIDIGSGSSFTKSSTDTQVSVYIRINSGTVIDNLTFYPMIRAASVTDATFAPYSNICPISGWTEVNVWVKPVYDPAANPTITIQLGSIVYGGTRDVTMGKLTVTDGYIASYNGETLPGEWISDRDVYSAGGAPTTGAQVVYKLATPIVYDLTPTEINTLIGTNNIWADTGEIKYIEYNV